MMVEATPLYTALRNYRDQSLLRLHMPGHGGRCELAPELEAIAGLDVTEVPGLDDLHLPQGVIAQAQQMLARACGAETSLMLVNGASSGIHALLLTMGEGHKIMIPRNAHRSVFAGLVLSGAEPVYLDCQLDPELGLALAVTAPSAGELWQKNQGVGALFITTPTYYGTCSDTKALAELAGQRRCPLLVDEAHGAHFPFHPGYPSTALQAGAAAAVCGLHKTWPVLTQGASLHLGKGYTSYPALRAAYDLLTTTSPSYPLMASIDWARAYMESCARADLERGLELAEEFKPLLNRIPGLRCHGEEWLQLEGITALDPLKAVIGLPGLSLDGYQLESLLRREYGLQVEMAAENYILVMFSLWHRREDWQRLYVALEDIAGRYKSARPRPGQVVVPPSGRMVMNPRQAFLAPKRTVPLAECRYELAGEMVAAYPPGIPCLLPGEIITEEVWDYLYYLKQTGAGLQGPDRPDLEEIKIIDKR